MGYWLGIAFSCLDVLCVAVFCDAFLERKTRGLRFVVGVLLYGVLSYIATVFVSHISEESPITLLKFAALITVYFVFASLLYTGKFWLRLLVVVLAYAISTLLEFCVLYSLLALLHIRYDEYVANMKLYLASAAITYSLKFLLSSGIKKIHKPMVASSASIKWAPLTIGFPLISLVGILGVSVRDAFRFERDERPLSKKTIREYVLFANQVLHFANERYHSVQAEFKMPAKGARPRFVDCIHEDEVCKLMSEIDKCSMPEQAIVLSLLNTGVRRAELAGLTWSDFDFKECTVHVNKSLLVFRDFGYQHTATKESNDRYIDVAPEYMEFMQQYKEWWYTKKRLMGASWQRDMVKNKESKRESLMRLAGEEFVIIDDFGWPRNPDGYNKLVKRVAQKAGISDIHPHMFRHTFVSLLMSNPDIGVATVAAEAGHAQPSTTLMIYTQQYKKRRESIRNQLSRELYEK